MKNIGRSAACGVLLGWAILSQRAWADERDDAIFAAPEPAADEGKEDTEAPASPPKSAPSDVSEQRDADIFGGGGPASDEDPHSAAADDASPPTRDDLVLGTPDEGPTLSATAAPSDPLQIGGLIFQQIRSSANEGQSVGDWNVGAPVLLDMYVDARPNEHLRAFARGRMSFDSTLPASAQATPGLGAMEVSGATMGVASLSSLFVAPTRGPRTFLDQLWLRWDIDNRAFVTVGKQHVRWGPSRFWTPSDFLHIRLRNPLDFIDARTGTTMAKVHIPFEESGTNVYVIAVLEDAAATSQLSQVGFAARAERVLGPTEWGVSTLLRDGRKPRLSGDVSAGIWDFDVYGELALRYGSEIDRVRYDENAALPEGRRPMPWEDPAAVGLQNLQGVVDALYPVYRDHGVKTQVVTGATYQRKYNDNDTLTLGVEYFYNPLGYDSPTTYPGLVLPHTRPPEDAASFFYLGRHYAALFVTLPAPYSWNYTTFTLSTIANLSDQSFLSRFDYSVSIVTHLTLQLFVSGRFGRREGEFRFGVSDLQIGELSFSRAPAMLDVGIAFRLAI